MHVFGGPKTNHVKTSKYWIGVFSNAPAVDPAGNGLSIAKGHVWVVLFNFEDNSIMARGLHPSKEITSANPECEGMIKNDSAEKFTVGRVYPINKELYDKYEKIFGRCCEKSAAIQGEVNELYEFCY